MNTCFLYFNHDSVVIDNKAPKKNGMPNNDNDLKGTLKYV